MGSSPHHGPAAVIITLPALLTACASPAPQRFEYAEIIMGVEARVVLYAPEENAARRAARTAFDRMADLDAVMSDYRVDSELSRLSRAAPGAAVAVSDDLYRVLQRARGFAEASGGAFDPTIGPLVTLWREARRSGRLPTDRALEEARHHSGWQAMSLEPRERTVTLDRPGMKLDLGGIGKGFAADEARAVLTKAGFARCLIDVGGDIAVGAPPPDRDGWRIGVGSTSKPWFVTLARAGIATSGDIEQFVEIDGTRYSHIVDPATGLGLTDRIQVTVIAPDATSADALASAVSVLGTGAGTALVERFPGSSVMYEGRNVRNGWRITSRSFPPPAEGSPGPAHLPGRVESATP